MSQQPEVPIEQPPPIDEAGAAQLDELAHFLNTVADDEGLPPDPPVGIVSLVATGRCPTTTWRGVLVCRHMAIKLDAAAKAVGNDIYVKPLAGCGSYQSTTAASAGTHAGGGAIDLDCRGLNASQKARVTNTLRDVGLSVSWNRDAIAGLWTHHNHTLDPCCPSLSRAAASQIVLFNQGHNGLVGNKPDVGSRKSVPAIWAQYVNRAIADAITVATASVAGKVTDVIQSIAGLPKIEVKDSPNQSARDGKITSITIHWWGDPARKPDFDGVVAWLCNPASEASAHYVLRADRVARLVPENRRAWHAGTRAGNDSSIGIEVDPNWTEATLRTLAALIADIRSRHGNLPLKGHKDWKSTQCPGTLYPQLARIDALARAAAKPAPAPQEDDIMAMTPTERTALINDIAQAVLNAPVSRPGTKTTWPLKTAIWSANTYALAAASRRIDVAELASAVAARIPADKDLTAGDIKAALSEALSEAVEITGTVEIQTKP